jgi:2-iminobutanoate/2-iminopropanoate deaminase
MIKKIFTADAPAAIGPYSQAIQAGGLIFFSGQIPLHADGTLCAGDITAQTKQVLQNMEAVLKAAGLVFSDVVKTTIYLTDLADFAVVNDLYGKCFSDPYPARACLQVAALPKGVDIEIEWVAVSA